MELYNASPMKPYIRGENIVYIVILLIIHWTLFFVLTNLDYLDYNLSKLFMYPAPIIAGLLSLLYSIGTRKGFIAEMPKDKEKKHILLLMSIVAISAALSIASLLL